MPLMVPLTLNLIDWSITWNGTISRFLQSFMENLQTKQTRDNADHGNCAVSTIFSAKFTKEMKSQQSCYL